MKRKMSLGFAVVCAIATPVLAEWTFVAEPTANAFIQSNDSTLELQCDRIRFAPAGYEDSEDIVAKQGLSIRFMQDGTTEVGAFQVVQDNAGVQIVDNYPVEISFNDAQDYGFVLDQLAANASVNLSMVDQDITYGIFDLAVVQRSHQVTKICLWRSGTGDCEHRSSGGRGLLWRRCRETPDRIRDPRHSGWRMGCRADREW